MTRHDRPVVIGALGLTQILAWGSTYYLPAVLAAPVVADTGWQLQWVLGSLSGGLLVAALLSPRIGAAIGIHGGRPVLVASAALIALGLAILALAPSLPIFVLGWLVIGAGMGAGLYDAAFAALGTIYGRDGRAAITTLTLYGGFASTVCWPLSALLIDQFGWRGACLVYAGLQAFLSLPLLAWTLPPHAKRWPGPAASSSGTSGRQATWLGVLLALALTVSALVSSTIAVQLLVLLQASGASLAAAVALGALMGPSQVGARVVEMAFGSRYHPLWTLSAGALLMAAGLGALAAGFPWLGATIVAYGAGNGIWSIARGAAPLALFGPDRYAVVMGRLARPALLASAAAPYLGGVLLERGGVGLSLQVLAGLSALNVAVVALLGLVHLSGPRSPA